MLYEVITLADALRSFKEIRVGQTVFVQGPAQDIFLPVMTENPGKGHDNIV